MTAQDPADRPALPEHDLIVLAGGGGSRLGGIDKAALEVGGRPLLDRVLDAARGARAVVVVGPVTVPDGIRQTVEDPPGGGPVAGVVAGLAVLAGSVAPADAVALAGPVAPQGSAAPAAPAPWTLVIAVDQPEAAPAVSDLLRGAAVADEATDMLCPEDGTGHQQWLLAAYRTASLRQALAAFGSGHGTAVRRVVAPLAVSVVDSTHVGDIDTWEDHARWQERLGLRD